MEKKLPRFLPGPMEGVMKPPLLDVWRQMEAFPVFLTPFLRITTGVPRRRLLKEFLDGFGFEPDRTIVQLMGIDPELMAQAASEFGELGVAGINVNFACPSRQVISGGAGGGMLLQHARMCEILSSMGKRNPGLPLSVKLRSGFYDPGEQKTFLPELLQSAKLDFIAMHYRTVKEGYLQSSGRTTRLAQTVTLAAGVPVYLNGDVNTPEEAEQLLAATGGCRIMSARGLLRDPYLGRRIMELETGLPVPVPEVARQIFWNGFSGMSLYKGWLIEISALVWGVHHPLTAELRTAKGKTIRPRSIG